MINRDLRLYFLAIGAPAILLTVWGIRLLFREAARAQEAEQASLQARAQYAASDICSQIRSVGDGQLARVARLAGNAKERQEMLTWLMKHDPYVRNVFIWEAGRGIVWPTAENGTDVQRAFLLRKGLQLGPDATWVDDWPESISGWTVGLGVNGPDVISWIRVATNVVCGMEIDVLTPLSRIPAALVANGTDNPGNTSPRATIAEVRDHHDRIVLPASSEPHPGSIYGEAPLDALLPGMRIRVMWRNGNEVMAGASWTLVANGSCLLALLVTSLVAGGGLLLRAANRARAESLMKTDFVSNVSHEFKTPLTSIRMCAELIAEDLLPDAQKRREAGRSIMEETGRLTEMVTDVLNFSRLERNRYSFELRNFPLISVVSELAPDAQIPPDIIVKADTGGLHHALRNLLENAAKYAAAGGPPEVVAERRTRGRVALHVRDRGPGVKPENLEKMFERFWRGDDSMTCEFGGSGLGLSIARQFARGMGGDLTVALRDGGGCEFTIWLKEGMTNG